MTTSRIPLSPARAAQDARRASHVAIAAHVFAQPVVRPLPRPPSPAGDAGVW